MTTIRPFSRKEAPGLTFVFNLPSKATGPGDFRDTSPCTLWMPKEEVATLPNGQPLWLPNGHMAKRIVYENTGVEHPLKELLAYCRDHANKALPWGTVYELRLALPMGLDDPKAVFDRDIWRVGYVALPTFDRVKARRGMRKAFGYYLLEKRVAGTPLDLTLPETTAEKQKFLGADRDLWVDRFKRA